MKLVLEVEFYKLVTYLVHASICSSKQCPMGIREMGKGDLLLFCV